MNFLKFAILFLSAIVMSSAYAECVDGKIKYQVKGKEVIHMESYCYDSDLQIFMSSRPCVKKDCQSKNLGTIDVKISEIAGERGSLGFKICEKFHGTPQIIEYWGKNNWVQSSRCLFSDGSFIDTASLSQKVKYQD
ncbi:MAG: hypothetical protein H7336_04295 [Bacteriovorax sp.]|nr:hypothetical protein [Bacteriovorax sp.]